MMLIRWKINTRWNGAFVRIGEVSEVTKAQAEDFVKRGGAEYVEEKAPALPKSKLKPPKVESEAVEPKKSEAPKKEESKDDDATASKSKKK